MPKQKPWAILKVRQVDETCDYCYYNRLAYHRHNIKGKSLTYDFEPISPDLVQCVCSDHTHCRDKTCSFYKRGIIDPKKKSAKENAA